MNITLPLRRAGPRCLSKRPNALALYQQTRAKSSDKPSNPILDEYLRKQEEKQAEMEKAGVKAEVAVGDLPSSSIFGDDQPARSTALRKESKKARTVEEELQERYPDRNVEVMSRVFDPQPTERKYWERRKIIQSIRKGTRMTKAEMIKRTEREHLLKSPNIKTSVKKLGMLARQVAGKTVEEALVQMRFSKKKAAKSVAENLTAARDEAVVMRGMGLGAAKAEGEEAEQSPSFDIQLKDGKRHKISDISKMYIDQAWVGRGPYGKLPDYRARGRVYIMRTPWTSISFLLKEEATRVREYKDREDKRRRRRMDKLWTQLPDRPLQGPRAQYYSW